MSKNYEGLSIETIRSALSYLDYEDSDQWLTAGFALYHELGEDGFDLWNNWSSLGSTYDKKNIKSRWKSFRKGNGGRPVTIGSLIYHAMNSGFKFDESKKVSPHVIQQRIERQKEIEKEQQEEARKVLRLQMSAKQKAQHIWKIAKPCNEHVYLTKKDVLPHDTKLFDWTWWDDNGNKQTEKDAMIFPLYKNDEIVSLQAIFSKRVPKNGKMLDKFLLGGAEKQGVHGILGELTHTILICEGWATGATLYESTQLYTIVAIDAGNIIHVAKEIRKKYPLHRIIICADNDQYKKSNTGIKAAEKASCAVDADVVYPIFKDIKDKPTDFNDLYHESGSNAVYEAVVKPTLYVAKENDYEFFNAFDLPFIEDAAKVLEESNSPLDVARAALVMAVRMSDKVPAFENIESVRKFIAHPLLNPRTHTSIMCRVQWAIQNRKRRAMTALKPQSWGKHHHVVVSDLSEFRTGTPCTLVFAPMGSGKTKKVILPFSKTPKKYFGAIAHRRSLIADLSAKLGVDNYDNMTYDKSNLAEKMAICLPSIEAGNIKPFVDKIQNVAVDEISQNIRFTNSKECRVQGANQEKIYLGLKKLINEVENVIVADASIDQTTLDFMQSARPDELFTIVEQIPTNKQRKCFLYADKSDLLTKIEVELMNGGNVWFSVESAERAEIINQLFCDKFKTLTITSRNNKSKKIKEFLDNVDKESKKYQLIIASPAISSGVSVEHQVPLLDQDGNQVYDENYDPVYYTQPHFTMIAGMASGHSICFSDFAQMLGRVRYVEHYHVCLQPNNKKFEWVMPSSILTGLRQAAMLEGVTYKENDYSQLKAHIDSLEETYRSDFANGFYWFLEYYCFEMMQGLVSNVDYTFSDRMKDISADRKDKYRASICNAKKISAEQAKEIDSKQDITSEEEFQLLAFKCRSSLGFDINHDIEIADIEMFEELPKLDRFARGLGYSFDLDDSEINISLRKFYNAQIQSVGIIFDGLDLRTAFFDEQVCNDLVNRISQNNNRFLLSSLKLIPSRYGQWRESKKGDLLEYKNPANNSKSVAQILDKFGLKWERSMSNGVRGHRVSRDSWNKMKYYADSRYKKAH